MGAVMDFITGKKDPFGPRVDEMSMKDRERLFFLMGMMYKSGLTTVEAFKTVAKAFKSEKKEDVAGAMNSMAQRIAQGRKVSKAMEAEPIMFNDVHRAAVMAGEVSNRMQQSFDILRMLENKKIENARGGVGELLTPASLLLMSLASFFNTGLNTLPVMADLAEQQGKTLPFLPSAMLAFTSACAEFWYVIVAAVVLIFITLYSMIKSAEGRFMLDGWIVDSPILGTFVRYKVYSQMLLYFPHLISSGVKPKQMTPIMEALATNLVLKRKVDMFNQTINTGGKMSQAMEKAGFPAVAVTPVQVSEHYAGQDDGVNDVMIEGMHHSYEIMERELADTHKRFMGIATTVIWIMGGGVMLLEMMSIVLTQSA
jgi:general secretion pathway protein F